MPSSEMAVLGTNAALIVNQKGLTVTGASGDNKVYNGNTDATITGGNLSGVVGGDTVTLENAATGTFASASVAVAGATKAR